MRLILTGLLVAALTANATLGWFFISHAQPDMATLEADLNEINAAIESTRSEEDKYQGGMILAQLQWRRSTLEATATMLDQKRRSFLRGIELSYTVDGVPLRPASADELAAIQSELDRIRQEIAEAREEAAQYRGGLILVMRLSAVATAQMTEAMLVQRYIAAKYGLAHPLVSEAARTPEKPPIGEKVKDADAL